MLLKVPQSWLQRSTSRPLSGPQHPFVEAMLEKARRDYTLPHDLESQVWDTGPEKFAKPGHARCREMAGTQSRGVVYQSTGDRHTATGIVSEQAPTLCTCVRTWVKKNGLRPRNIKKSLMKASPPCTVPNCPQCALRAQGGGGLCATCEHPKWTHNDHVDQRTSWAPSHGWCGHGNQGCAWDRDDQEPRHQFKPMDVGETLPNDIRDLKIDKAINPFRREGLPRHYNWKCDSCGASGTSDKGLIPSNECPSCKTRNQLAYREVGPSMPDELPSDIRDLKLSMAKSDHNPDFYHYQDKHMEHLPKEIRSNREVGFALERAMDIHREVALNGHRASPHYISEKVEGLHATLHHPYTSDKLRKPMSDEDHERAQQIVRHYDANHHFGPVGHAVRDLVGSLANQQPDLARRHLQRVRDAVSQPIQKSDGITDTVSPTKSPTLVLVRHPDTKLNREGKTRGWSNPPIDEGGKQDARKTTAEIAREFQVGRVASSDLQRAAVFAKMIGKATGAPVITSKRLRPWNLGEMTGKPSKAVMPEMLRYVATPDKAIPGGGESWNDFLERSLGAMRVLLNETRDEQKATVVVTHTRNIRSLLGWLEGGEAGIKKYVAEEKDPVEPADFVAIRFDGKNWTPEKDVEGARDPGRLAKSWYCYPHPSHEHKTMDEQAACGKRAFAEAPKCAKCGDPIYEEQDGLPLDGKHPACVAIERMQGRGLSVLNPSNVHKVANPLHEAPDKLPSDIDKYKSFAKAGPPADKKPGDKKDGGAAQPKASLQDIKPGPSKIDHTTVPHGKKVWVAIKTGPLAGRPVVLRRKESGHFTIAASKDAPNAVGRRPIAEPSAAHKTLYPEATSDEAETQASIGLSHGNVQGAALGKTIDETLPNARKDMNDAGVEPWHRTPSVGEGYYAEPGFPTTPENDIDLHMAGSRRSVRWVTAKMASEGKQHQAFIFHHSKTGATPMTRIQLGPKINPQNFSKAMAVVAEQLPKQGWHVAYDSEGKPREVVIAGIGKQKSEHRAQIKRVRAALEKHRLKLGKNYHHQVDVESLCDDKPDSSGHCATHGGQTYDAVLKRGHGFKGWYDGPSLRGRRDRRGAVDGGGSAGSGGGDRGGLQSPADRGGTAGGGAEHPGRAGRGGLGRDEPSHHSTEPPIDIGDEWRAEDKEDTEALVKQAVRRAKRNKNLAKYDYTDEDRAAIRKMAADPEHIKELVRTYKSLSDDQKAAGHGWYHVTRAKIKHMAKTHGVPYKIAAAAVAAMSPRTGWANNLKGASALMERHVKGQAMPERNEEIGYGGYMANTIKAWRILKGESPDVVLDETAERTSGDKVRNFYRNFMNDQHAVTVDTWAQKGADKDREYRPIGKTSQYQPYQNAYKRAALKLGITPEALQAAVWLKVRKDEESKPGARNPWSRQEEGGYVPEGAYMKSQAVFDPSSVIMRKSESRDEESDISAEREQLRLRLLRLPPVGVAHDAVVQMISDLDDLVA